MTRFTPYSTAFSLFLLDKKTARPDEVVPRQSDEPESLPPIWRLPQPYPHAHEDHEINIVTGGSCRYVWSGQGGTHAATVAVGEMFVIPGGVEHSVEVDHFATVRGLWIHPDMVSALSGRTATETERLINTQRPLTPRLISSMTQNTVLQELFEQAQSEYVRGDDPLQTETLRTLGRLAAISLVRLMTHTQHSPTSGGQSSAEARVAAVRTFVDRNYLREISLREMTEMACLAPSQFTLLFRRLTGESPKAYLIVRRLKHAATCLENSDLPVSYIAWNSGFTDQAGFNHLFKNHFDIAPGDYRKKHQRERRLRQDAAYAPRI